MDWNLIAASLIPLAGSTAGAAFVYLFRNGLSKLLTRTMAGFAAGVMSAASVWSLLIPAMEESRSLGNWAFLPAVTGFWLGMALLLLMDHVIPHLHPDSLEPEGPHSHLRKTTMLMFAITLHNVPEGMAMGAVLAGLAAGGQGLGVAAALALSIGIAIQNIPEGAIVSMPLMGLGFSRRKAFWMGVLSGVVEPLAAWAMILFSHWIGAMLPVFLGFAAGAMMYVVVEELIPEMAVGEHSNWPSICFGIGFTLMMVLDIALG